MAAVGSLDRVDGQEPQGTDRKLVDGIECMEIRNNGNIGNGWFGHGNSSYLSGHRAFIVQEESHAVDEARRLPWRATPAETGRMWGRMVARRAES